MLPTTLSPEGFARAEAALQQVRIAIAERLDWQSSFAWLDWPKQTALVCDNHTWHALGEALSQVLQASGFEITLINLGSAPKPTDSTAQYIAETAHECGGLVAVGSGTINDLTQYAAHQLGKPYIICG
ncbi:MAG: iron-containing alcohol dehydrogenase, partial [Rickettsiales bacterium]